MTLIQAIAIFFLQGNRHAVLVMSLPCETSFQGTAFKLRPWNPLSVSWLGEAKKAWKACRIAKARQWQKRESRSGAKAAAAKCPAQRRKTMNAWGHATRNGRIKQGEAKKIHSNGERDWPKWNDGTHPTEKEEEMRELTRKIVEWARTMQTTHWSWGFRDITDGENMGAGTQRNRRSCNLLERTLLRALVFSTLFWPHFGAPRLLSGREGLLPEPGFAWSLWLLFFLQLWLLCFLLSSDAISLWMDKSWILA